MTTLERALELHFAQERAINAAWRWARRQTKPTISFEEIWIRVEARCPEADRQYVRSEIKRRMNRSRSRRACRTPAPLAQGYGSGSV
jgi:hypothetical protein